MPAPSRTLTLAQGERGKTLLRRMLDAEKVLGTSERDPNQRRHDWNYFRESSRFVLIEDIHGELATLGYHEYTPPPPCKEGETPAKAPWPEVHLFEWSRNPFARPEEKDKKRWERLQQAKKVPDHQEEEEQKKKDKLATLALLRKGKGLKHANKGGIDLRRTVSMSNMRRHNPQVAQPPVNPEGTGTAADIEDNPENLRASGFLPSGSMNHVAASGNSVSITSTTCTTTSVADHMLRKTSSLLKEHRLVTTSLKHGRVQSFDAETKSAMGPPATVPQRLPMLKKSKSTNTLKLPKRDEGCKPGYCECCRLKFEDFNEVCRFAMLFFFTWI